MGVLIIAEAGVNHNGDLSMAKQLVDIAAKAKADYVKFQTFKAENLVSKTAQKAEYQKRNINDDDDSQYKMLKSLELSYQDHIELIDYCNTKNIKFLSTAFDLESLDLLYNLGIRLFKIPSGEITNYPYIKKLGRYADKIILSTGMSDMNDILATIKLLESVGFDKKNIVVLHCNTEYPTPFEDVNLLAMNTIASELNVSVGYSDHTLGIEVPIAAVAMGAVCIEKHFTIDRGLKGPDHLASLEPDELKAMVSSIRNIEKALGSAQKQPSPSELKNKAIARKSIHIKTDLPKGHILTEDDFEMKRPGTGISPMETPNIVGKKLLNDIKAEDILRQTDFS